MLLSFGKYANIRLMRLFCTVALLSSVALAAGLEEGDSCKLHSGAIGICRQDNMCDAIKDAINNRELTVQDVVHCGFWQMGELICCPTNQPVTLPPPTTTTEFIFSTSTTAATVGDFWEFLLTTSTTPQPPKPLIVEGKELSSKSEFFDFSKLLTGKGDPNGNGDEMARPKQNSQLNLVSQESSWNNQGLQNQGAIMGGNRRNQNQNQGDRFRPNSGRGSFGPEPNQAAFGNQMTANNNRGFRNGNGFRNVNGNGNRGTPINPNSSPQFIQQNPRVPGNGNRNGRISSSNSAPNRANNMDQRRKDFTFPNTESNGWVITGNDVEEMRPSQGPAASETNPNHNIWSNSQPNAASDDLDAAASNRLIFWPNGNRPIAETPKSVDNPISMVFDNLVNSGMDIVKAKQENVERAWERQQANFMLTTTTTTQAPRTLDPFAPFQFRPQPTGIGFPAASNDWNVDGSSSSVRSETRNDLTNSERPAVRACQQIDAGLSAALTPHILNGVRAEDKEFPHMAAIGVRDIGSTTGPYIFNCGGSLIASRYVLTAAHCVIRITPSIVRMGVTDIMTDTNAVDIPIAETIIHPRYRSGSVYDDIALLRLDQAITYSLEVYPICLYTELGDPLGNPLYVTGWGTVNTSTRQVSNVLLKAELQIDNLDRCNASYVQQGVTRRNAQGVVESQLCAHDTKKSGTARSDACQGDSGGPLNLIVDADLKKYRVVGLVSVGFDCGNDIPGLYTRVSAFVDWIEEIVWPNGVVEEAVLMSRK